MNMGGLAGAVPSEEGGGLTVYVFAAAFIAAQAGLIFGYDLVRTACRGPLDSSTLHVGALLQ